jgi:hypothetical protein
MILMRETAGDTLQGVIDGSNRIYLASYDFYDDIRVNIYVNGRLKVREWEDGFSVTMPRTVVLNEALLDGDSLEVEYYSGTRTGGGADGGCPAKPQVAIMRPATETGEPRPCAGAQDVKPDLETVGEPEPAAYPEDLRPVILSIEGE